MSIIKPDPYLAHYIFEKETNPDAKIVLKAFRKSVVETVDNIVALAHGQRDFVVNESDWKVVEALCNFFAYQWPQEFEEFKATIPDIRSSRNDGGYSENKEMMYVGAIPPRLMKLIKAIFPAQQWDKKFTNKFVNRFKLFKVGGA